MTVFWLTLIHLPLNWTCSIPPDICVDYILKVCECRCFRANCKQRQEKQSVKFRFHFNYLFDSLCDRFLALMPSGVFKSFMA